MIDRAAVIAMRQKGEGLTKYGKPWTNEERKLLDEYFDDGIGITEIAVLLGRSETAVMQQFVYNQAFKSETVDRVSSKGTCRCDRCDLKADCQFSPQNREGLWSRRDGAHV